MRWAGCRDGLKSMQCPGRAIAVCVLLKKLQLDRNTELCGQTLVSIPGRFLTSSLATVQTSHQWEVGTDLGQKKAWSQDRN
jgi:hypothetical protein